MGLILDYPGLPPWVFQTLSQGAGFGGLDHPLLEYAICKLVHLSTQRPALVANRYFEGSDLVKHKCLYYILLPEQRCRLIIRETTQMIL